ncbi:methyl-accepting chemotaxis protein [Amphritea sp. 1_MG-2023]|uniref:methyl-accepting chemotaxis protein n=1 Tax=Amphritea sp. 1_MG-2023 TaxID=3062670 RepID=UPI0026E1931F|nr:methyl-accepting chemotaxis protein [Amphritea sp. 1_MG-2023]MDO6564579.1 methyl-accepting chemotaxis protein [Amphritea sp. 1_MG-2023]
MRLYNTLEQTFFNTLTRKIVANVVLLLIPTLLFMGLNWSGLDQLKQLLASTNNTDVNNPDLIAHLNHLQMLSWLVLAFSFAVSLFSIFFMRYLFLRPIRKMVDVLSDIKDKDGDISATLPDMTHDEISMMARSYNGFSDSLKKIIAETRNHSVKVALSATQLSQVLQQVYQSTNDQEEQAQQVLLSSQESTSAIQEVAGNTLKISEYTRNNLAEIKTSSHELEEALGQVRNISALASGFQQTVEKLSASSETITEILSMVKRFSDQTNLLALNASIEAARAGEAGRGFAVVADEVRTLSQQVQDATTEIDQNISVMAELVGDTRTNSANILEYTRNTEGFISDTSEQFTRLVRDFEDVNSQLTTISSTLDELSYSNKESHSHVERIAGISGDIRDEMKCSRTFSGELEASTEQTQELLSRFIIGYGSFEQIIQAGREWARQMQDNLEQMYSQGYDIFDHNYQRTNEGRLPEKFDVSYADVFEQRMQPIFDGYLVAKPDLIYALPICLDGYAPAHHRKVSEPLTGDYEVDNVNSRHRRFFTGSRAEVRRTSNTAPFLLQTFVRDTGEVLNDLTFPIYVDGRHWGCFALGFKPELLQDRDTAG